MFDYDKPISKQILEYMEKLDYPKESIQYARQKIIIEKDLEFTLNLVKTIMHTMIGKTIIDLYKEDLK